MNAIDNFNGLAFFLHSRMAENFFRHSWTYIKICHVYLSSGNIFSIKSKMIILHAFPNDDVDQMNVLQSWWREGKCNISIPFLTTIYDHRQSACLSLFYFFARTFYSLLYLWLLIVRIIDYMINYRRL